MTISQKIDKAWILLRNPHKTGVKGRYSLLYFQVAAYYALLKLGAINSDEVVSFCSQYDGKDWTGDLGFKKGDWFYYNGEQWIKCGN